MCKRSEQDPLIRLLTDRYRLNILRVPRAGIEVGDLLVDDSGDLRRMGAFAKFFDPVLEMPESKTAALAPQSSKKSGSISWNAAAKPATAFLAALGLTGVTSLSATLESAQDVSVTFQITGATLENLDAVDLGNELAARELRRDNALYQADRKFFVAHEVARATGLTLGFQSSSKAGAKLAAGIAQVAEASAGVSVQRASAAEIGVTGTTPLVFGLAVLRLTETKENGALRLDLPKKLQPVRRIPDEAQPVPEARAALEFLFGGAEGEVLLDIGDAAQL
jgi:hypothetical protein